MTPHTLTLEVPPWGRRTLHFHSRFAGRLGGSTNCVSPNATDIYIAQDHITRDTLAHEWGHGEDAKRLGWRYLPWVAWCFVTQGYAKSDAEKSADMFANVNAYRFPAEVRCDDE